MSRTIKYYACFSTNVVDAEESTDSNKPVYVGGEGYIDLPADLTPPNLRENMRNFILSLLAAKQVTESQVTYSTWKPVDQRSRAYEKLAK
jgi:hypothetical protein